MSNNTFWACTNISIATVLVVLMVTRHIANIETIKAQLEEHKYATEAGLQQQLVGYQKIWVKVKE